MCFHQLRDLGFETTVLAPQSFALPPEQQLYALLALSRWRRACRGRTIWGRACAAALLRLVLNLVIVLFLNVFHWPCLRIVGRLLPHRMVRLTLHTGRCLLQPSKWRPLRLWLAVLPAVENHAEAARLERCERGSVESARGGGELREPSVPGVPLQSAQQQPRSAASLAGVVHTKASDIAHALALPMPQPDHPHWHHAPLLRHDPEVGGTARV